MRSSNKLDSHECAVKSRPYRPDGTATFSVCVGIVWESGLRHGTIQVVSSSLLAPTEQNCVVRRLIVIVFPTQEKHSCHRSAILTEPNPLHTKIIDPIPNPTQPAGQPDHGQLWPAMVTSRWRCFGWRGASYSSLTLPSAPCRSTSLRFSPLQDSTPVRWPPTAWSLLWTTSVCSRSTWRNSKRSESIQPSSVASKPSLSSTQVCFHSLRHSYPSSSFS